MPRVDGFELARRIRADARFDKTPLVLLTSFFDRTHHGDVREQGFAGYLSKPLRESRLLECLRTVLGAAGSEQPSPAPALPAARPAVVNEMTLSMTKIRRRPRVLLAEDNAVNCKVAVRLLEKLQCVVDVAKHGGFAIEAVANAEYDFVLMDCQMPEVDGFEATRRLRQAEAGTGRHLPIIALTANAMPGDAERCRAAGMDDHLAKPIRADDLQRMIAKWSAVRAK
jgi:CheY-like chemotaxis protein